MTEAQNHSDVSMKYLFPLIFNHWLAIQHYKAINFNIY